MQKDMLYEIVIDHGYGGLNPVQIGKERCAPDHDFGPAVRTHWLLHYVVSGFGTFTRDGVVHHIGPGEVFVIPPYVETYYRADSQNPWHYIWIGFTTEEEIPEPLTQPVLSLAGVGEIFEQMLYCHNLENGRSAYLCACLWRLWALLIEEASPTPDYIDQALNLMHSEYSNGITVKEIAARIGLDRSYFTTLFAERVETSPGEYLSNLRFHKAIDLLSSGQSITTTALSVGYNDVFQFSKAFKKHFGLSPREFMKKKSSTI